MKGRRPSAGVAGRDTIDVDSSEESGTNTASAAATTSSTAARDSVSQRKVCGNHVHGNVDCEGREGAHDACPVERGEGDAMSAGPTPERGGDAREPSASRPVGTPNPSRPGVSSSSSSSSFSTNPTAEGPVKELDRDNSSTTSTSVHNGNVADVSSPMMSCRSHKDSERSRDEVNCEAGEEQGLAEGERCLASLIEEAEWLQIEGEGGGGKGVEGRREERRGEERGEGESDSDSQEGEDDGERETKIGKHGRESREQLQSPVNSGSGDLSQLPCSAFSPRSSSTTQSVAPPPFNRATAPAFPFLARTSSEPRPPVHCFTRGSIPASSEATGFKRMPRDLATGRRVCFYFNNKVCAASDRCPFVHVKVDPSLITPGTFHKPVPASATPTAAPLSLPPSLHPSRSHSSRNGGEAMHLQQLQQQQQQQQQRYRTPTSRPSSFVRSYSMGNDSGRGHIPFPPPLPQEVRGEGEGGAEGERTERRVPLLQPQQQQHQQEEEEEEETMYGYEGGGGEYWEGQQQEQQVSPSVHRHYMQLPPAVAAEGGAGRERGNGEEQKGGGGKGGGGRGGGEFPFPSWRRQKGNRERGRRGWTRGSSRAVEVVEGEGEEGDGAYSESTHPLHQQSYNYSVDGPPAPSFLPAQAPLVGGAFHPPQHLPPSFSSYYARGPAAAVGPLRPSPLPPAPPAYVYYQYIPPSHPPYPILYASSHPPAYPPYLPEGAAAPSIHLMGGREGGVGADGGREGGWEKHWLEQQQHIYHPHMQDEYQQMHMADVAESKRGWEGGTGWGREGGREREMERGREGGRERYSYYQQQYHHR